MSDQTRALFAHCKSRFDRQDGGGLICKQGFYNNSSVLKLQKPSWTNDPMDQVRNTSGIFFSIWIDGKSAPASRADYNIHALKLRQLKGYLITSRDFADCFRAAFAPMRGSWPNVSVDYGPLTLMQGWIPIVPETLEEEIFILLERFKLVTPLIDRLLESRRSATKVIA